MPLSRCLRTGNLEILEWLTQYGLKTSSYIIPTIITYRNIYVLLWLTQNGVIWESPSLDEYRFLSYMIE